MAQTSRQSTSTCNYHPNAELKLNSELELVGLSSTISSQEINISFPSALSINPFDKVPGSLFTNVFL